MKKLVMTACLTLGISAGADAATIFGVDETNNLVTFDSASPGTITSSVQITSADNASFDALDFRPLNGVLYGLSGDRAVYTINTATGVATALTDPLDIEGAFFGFDFNPTIDRIRVVTNRNNNYVVNPNDGAFTTATDLFYADGDPNAGRDPGVSSVAYTSAPFDPSMPGATQLYAIDTDLDVLAELANSAGTLDTVGSLGVNLGSRASFDILGSDAFVFNGNTLYSVDLGSGALTRVGNTDRGLFGIAIGPGAVPEPATWAMMLLGFGVVGYSMRRRPSARFAQAA